MFLRCMFAVALITLGGICVSVIACEIRVRDSAFRTSRDVHKLCLIAGAADESADAIEQRLTQWLDQTGDAFNLEFVRVDADDPETNWQSIGIPSAPPSLPVTVLVGRDNGIGQSFVIDHWEPEPSDEQLALIHDSPIRQRLAGELADHIAVLIYAAVPGGDASRSEMIESIVAKGVADERIGLSTITLDRNDPAEQLLCRFMGLRAGNPDTLCVAFGRGKLMSPPLVGDEITEENVGKLVTQIRQACSCSKPLPTMGVDVPLVWSDEVDSAVVLMDAELDIATLDTELQNMLAGKSAGDDSDEPTLVQIPEGSGQAAVAVTSTAATPTAATTRQSNVILAIAAAIFAIVLGIALLRGKTQTNQ